MRLLILTSVAILALGSLAWHWLTPVSGFSPRPQGSTNLDAQRVYQGSVVHCTVEFPSGFAHRVTAYDPFTFSGRRAEIATSHSAVDGEAWAEFYALEAGDSAEKFLPESFANVTHALVRARLWHLFDYALPNQVDELRDKLRVIAEVSADEWHLRLSYLPSPHGASEVSAIQVPRSELRAEDVVAQLPSFGIPSNTNQVLSPWIWVGIDDFRRQADRTAFRRAEREALDRLKEQQLEFRKAKDRFERMHRDFYLVEAARQVSAGQALVLRRFGSVVSPATPAEATRVIEGMMRSVRCA